MCRSHIPNKQKRKAQVSLAGRANGGPHRILVRTQSPLCKIWCWIPHDISFGSADDWISLKLQYAMDNYLFLPCTSTQYTPMQSLNRFLRHLFNGTVQMEFGVCFSIAKYKNDIFWLFETSQMIISIIHFHKLIMIKTMLKMWAFCKVYLQYGIVNQRVVTQQGFIVIFLEQNLDLFWEIMQQ